MGFVNLTQTGGGDGGSGSGGLDGDLGAADDKVLRSDGTGGSTAQASGATLDDGVNLTINSLLCYAGGNQSGDEKAQIAGGPGGTLLSSDSDVRWYGDLDISAGSPDVGLARSGAGVLAVTNGGAGAGSIAAGRLDVDNVRVDGSTLSTTNANGDLLLSPQGTGAVAVSTNLQLGSGARVRNSSGDLEVRNAANSDYAPVGASFFFAISSTNYRAKMLAGEGIVLASGAQLLFSTLGTLGGVTTGDSGEARDAAGVIRDTNGSSGLGSRLTGRPVEASTAGSGSPNLLGAIESRKLLTNEGAPAEAYNTLPTSAPVGYEQPFYCQSANGIRITAPTGCTIRLSPSQVSAAAGFVRSSTVGSGCILTKINATEFVAVVPPNGTWTVDS
jgi:hypothetical protein